MKTITLFLLTGFLSISTLFAQEEHSTNTETSNLQLPRIQVIPIKDTKENRQYELYVKLPEGYSDTTMHPVIYYTDAMWHVEMLSGSAEYIMEEAILVGISWQKDINQALIDERGAHVSRFRDYSFRPHNNPEIQAKYQFGQADKHLNFIRKDVIPYIEDNYRADSTNRSYFGYSMGGEFGTYVLLTEPGTFKNYILGSPSLRADDFSDLADLNTAALKRLNANVFISYGTLEEKSGVQIERLISLLKNRNDQSLLLHPAVIDGDHQTAFPSTVVKSVIWLSKMGR